ncbi:BA75_04076T0 [Komagataella pastoris]|uniref:BA75_04076T0 n=1 Tax=Komagataella pastoris TaxID=4922 RepID=A0A1B2JGS2_PICPA|nr:BA75_04076T0 [Komagataella pastoris]
MAKRHKNMAKRAAAARLEKKKYKGSNLGKKKGDSQRKKSHTLGGDDSDEEFQELYNVNRPSQRPNKKKTLVNAAKRGKKPRMIDEVGFTNRNIADTMKKQLRNNPIEFVKSKDVFDPSADLIKRLNENKKRKEIIEERADQDDDENLVEDFEMVDESEVSRSEEVDGDEDEQEIKQAESEEEQSERFQNGDKETDSSPAQGESDSPASEEPLFYVDDTPDIGDWPKQNIVPPSQLPNPPSPLSIDIRRYDEDESSDDQYVTVGNVMMKVNMDEGEMYVNAPSGSLEQSENEDEESDPEEKVFISQAPKATQKEVKHKPKPSPSYPEFGFLAEDYEMFDVSTIIVLNIRQSYKSTQYEVQSERLLGISQAQWLEEDFLVDMLIEYGLLDHRVDAYLDYIKKPFLKELSPEPDYPIDDSDEEESEDDFEMENIEGLIALQKNKMMNDVGFETDMFTQTIEFRGKGKNRRPILDHIHDEDLKLELLEQFGLQNSKPARQKGKKAEGLCEKYPHLLHINEIKEEFEQFYHDSSMTTLRFPPLDPHGIRTLLKLADHYQMKGRKFLKGKRQHVTVIKTKRTHYLSPEYDMIGRLLRQRRVFNRIDVSKKDFSKDKLIKGASKSHVKEGEIVGSRAPEIGQDNIGRRMLERLGWSKGEGLGLDSRGVTEPVLAKIKKSRLGLRKE